LGDVVLAEAAVDGPTGLSTGYLERVYQAATGEALQHALVNASRVDWQVRQDGKPGTLIEPLWAPLLAEFQSAGIRGRLALIKLLEKVAYFQPDRTLALARWAIESPSETVEEVDHPLASLFPSDYEDVLHDLPAVLKNVGHNLDQLPAAMDALWDL